MAYWLRRPPSRQHVYVMAIVAALAALIVTIEHLGYWPDWMTAQRMPRSPL
ncbi:hypothetical protein KYK30_21930 [Shinella yambaruensis]|uniref:hypothetical protein n=1 Tax=Shinella yambaruensis TaxID=415996 RepID=UPI001FD53EFE|nr:hypothetical protein [Shinella yambaruensis]MCJ8026570.1 hypothetical protein [Shinella yambaruensis]MCU7982364.1 hypothetical protein [Shinella yambaruensis]